MRSSSLHPHSSLPNVAVASSHPQQSLLPVGVPCLIGTGCLSHPRLFLVAKNIKHSSKDRAPWCIKAGENNGSLLPDAVEEEDEGCPVDCVREFYTDEEFTKILEKAKKTHALVVVDFYRTSCGSCKYIEQRFVRLCKGSNDQDTPVVFLKHNVIDEYDEQSEVADRLRIKVVPLFHFYKDGVLLEAFPTRDKERLMEAIRKYATIA